MSYHSSFGNAVNSGAVDQQPATTKQKMIGALGMIGVFLTIWVVFKAQPRGAVMKRGRRRVKALPLP